MLCVSVALVESSAQSLLFVVVCVLSTRNIVVFEEDLIVLFVRDEFG